MLSNLVIAPTRIPGTWLRRVYFANIDQWIVKVELNRITIRDVHLLLSEAEFSEEFADYIVAFFNHFFSWYDYVDLDKVSKDLTDFITPLGLTKMTTLLQDATNLVAQFVRIVTKILANYLRDWAK